jgi:hypothetical protein
MIVNLGLQMYSIVIFVNLKFSKILCNLYLFTETEEIQAAQMRETEFDFETFLKK